MKCLKCAAVFCFFSEGRVAYNLEHGDSFKETVAKEMDKTCFRVLPLL